MGALEETASKCIITDVNNRDHAARTVRKLSLKISMRGLSRYTLTGKIELLVWESGAVK